MRTFVSICGTGTGPNGWRRAAATPRRPLLVVTLLAVVVALLPGVASARSGSAVVMTRNLYLGADLTPAIAAADAPELFRAAADAYGNVLDTDYAQRSDLIADEIAETAPDLIGLQEVALWRTGAFLDPADATVTAIDFLAVLEDDLRSRGLPYTTAVVQPTFDAEVPASVSSTGVRVLKDIRLTQRNVILVRDGVSYRNVQTGTYDTNLVFPDVGGVPGNDLVDLRGWQSLDVLRADGRESFRFVNTHLDAFSDPVREAQAQELVDGPLRTRHKLVAVGDFNSPPTGPGSGAYRILTSRSDGKLRDAWIQANADDTGFTFGQAPDLRNPESTASTRIDLVLTRTPAVKTVGAQLVGDEAKTTGGLWASDHFGVVAELSPPR